MKHRHRIVLLLITLLALAHAPRASAADSPANTPVDVPAAAAELDRLLVQDWLGRGIQGNPPASDEIMVRRLYLDIVGRIPTLAETRGFLEDRATDKRTRLIDTLLASEGHTLHMFHWWADLLRLCHSNPGTASICGQEYALYVKESLRANKPYDQLVRELVTAGGNSWENPAIGFAMRNRGMPLDHAAITTRIFLGTRIECAQCHDHPFDKWTQMQFFQNAAYTHAYDAIDYYSPHFDEAKKRVAEMQKKDGPKSHRALYAAVVHSVLPLRNQTVRWLDNQTLQLQDYQYTDARPRTVVPPGVLMGAAPDLGKYPRSNAAYAAWLTAPKNPRFTRVIANRMWKKVFGHGLIEPADEILDSTVPSHPALMAALEKLMVDQRYDLRAFLRVLYNTRAYQAQVTRAELQPGDDYRFPGPLLRRMSAEQIWDSFVTLVQPAVDATNEETVRRSRRNMAARRKLDDALKTMPPEEMLERAARDVAPIFDGQNAKVSEIQARLNAARADKKTDPAVLKAIGEELKNSMGDYQRALSDYILVPATLRLAERVTGGPVARPDPPDKDAAQKQVTSSAFGSLGTYEHIRIPGYDIDEPTAAEIKTAQERLFRADAERLGIPPGEQAAYVAHRFAIQPGWFRAAELPSPAPPGHVLRELGQSDREVIENASTEASIPQALLLMNSPILNDILSPHSVLKRGLPSAASAPAVRADAIFLTLLSRHPTPAELTTLEKSGLDGLDDLIRALLNTQQFLFIQ